ncbi:MAG TPA: hydroxymethylbilane synthase [Actinomycetota bacterium]|nr:hydroxymethylbilane synthase [Actinomycetota bacterium]
MTTLRIATRRSALALAQAEEVAALLSANAFRSEIVPMSTSGDEGVASTESPSGMKGLWVDRILEALRTGEVDVAVHSAKDLPAEDEDDIVIAAVPRRADPLDVLIGREATLPPGLVVGTSSVRRRAQLLAGFPGMGVTEIRGNVDTRLRKLADGEVDGLVLAAAGLGRLGIDPPNSRRLRVDEMVPAPGQGSLAVQVRAEDRTTRAVVSVLDHLPSRRALEAERALVQLLGGGCDLPLGALAAAKGDRIRMVALVATLDGAKVVRTASESTDPSIVASALAERLRADGADRILAEVQGTQE